MNLRVRRVIAGGGFDFVSAMVGACRRVDVADGEGGREGVVHRLLRFFRPQENPIVEVNAGTNLYRRHVGFFLDK
jgi:hypothetical protein